MEASARGGTDKMAEQTALRHQLPHSLPHRQGDTFPVQIGVTAQSAAVVMRTFAFLQRNLPLPDALSSPTSQAAGRAWDCTACTSSTSSTVSPVEDLVIVIASVLDGEMRTHWCRRRDCISPSLIGSGQGKHRDNKARPPSSAGDGRTWLVRPMETKPDIFPSLPQVRPAKWRCVPDVR